MYSWNVPALAQELKTNQLPEREKMKYLLADAVFTTIVLEIPSRSQEAYSVVDFGGFLITLLLIIGGTYLCYEANQLGDSRDFVARFICLSWPVTIRLLVYFALLYIPFAVFGGSLEQGSPSDKVALVMIDIVLVAAYYLWIRSQLLWISGAFVRKTDQLAPQG